MALHHQSNTAMIRGRCILTMRRPAGTVRHPSEATASNEVVEETD
jgi:hypothetical protein